MDLREQDVGATMELGTKCIEVIKGGPEALKGGLIDWNNAGGSIANCMQKPNLMNDQYRAIWEVLLTK